MFGLFIGVIICFYDGNSGYLDLGILWCFVEEIGIIVFGVGVVYFFNCKKVGIELL